MSSPFVLVAQLWMAPDRREEFERFESAASAIMRRHGGRIERRVSLREGVSGSPDEIHIVSFPSQRAYQSYREDPELAALAELRSRAILRTVIWEGANEPPFGE